MKKILFALIFLICISTVNAEIVSENQTISFTVYNLDSLGQPRGFLDTVYVVVKDSVGSVIFSETLNDGGTNTWGSYVVQSIVGTYDTTYEYHRLVSVLTTNGGVGLYKVILKSVSNVTGGWLKFSKAFPLQVISTATPLASVVDSTNAMSNNVYSKFIDGSNEDVFKATGFSTHSAADVWSSVSRTLTDFSFTVTLTDGQFTKISDTVLADSSSYQGSASGLTAADIWTYGTRTLSTFAFTVGLSAGEYTKIGDTVGEISAPSEADIYSYFISGSNEDAFKATGFSTFDYTSNKVTVNDSTAEDISYIANNQGDYKATGFSTHSASDVWSVVSRTLTDFGFNVNVNTIGTGAIVAGSIAAGALDNKGNWVTSADLPDSTRLYRVDKEILAGISADSVSVDSLIYQGAAAGFDHTSDSVIVDMSSFNSALDNDSSLIMFLRASIALMQYLSADIDTLEWLSGNKDGYKSTTTTSNASDIVYKYINGILVREYRTYHPNGRPGGPPDSVKVSNP